VGEYLTRHAYSAAFAQYYLVPMAAALWSSSGAEVMNFSALTMISFFHNHSMLQVSQRSAQMCRMALAKDKDTTAAASTSVTTTQRYASVHQFLMETADGPVLVFWLPLDVDTLCVKCLVT
jgi:predicted NAD/FAD-binding protein